MAPLRINRCASTDLSAGLHLSEHEEDSLELVPLNGTVAVLVGQVHQIVDDLLLHLQPWTMSRCANVSGDTLSL